MRLVYCVISCDRDSEDRSFALGIVLNSQMASSLSQICVVCSTMKMSSFPIEREKKIQAKKSYRFFIVAANLRSKKSLMAPHTGSLTFASPRSAHVFSLFLVSGRVSYRWRYWLKRSTLCYVSFIATVSNNTYSLHSATIMRHTIAYSHIFFSEMKHCYSRSDFRSQLVPFSTIPWSWTWKCAKL